MTDIKLTKQEILIDKIVENYINKCEETKAIENESFGDINIDSDWEAASLFRSTTVAAMKGLQSNWLVIQDYIYKCAKDEQLNRPWKYYFKLLYDLNYKSM